MITNHCHNDAGFYSGLCLFTFLRSLFVHVTLRCYLFVSPSGPMSVFYRIGFLIMNTFSFYLTWGYPPLFDWSIVDVHLPHSWGSVPSDTGFLVDTVFTWDFDCVSPLSSGCQSFWWEACWWLYWGPSWAMLQWSLDAVSILPSSLAFGSLIIMCLVWVSRVHLMWSSLHFLDIYIHIFTLTLSVFTFGKFQPLFLHSSGPLSLSSGDVRAVRVYVRLMVPWVLQTDYFSSVLSFCSSVSIIFIVLFQVLCFVSACSNLPFQ